MSIFLKELATFYAKKQQVLVDALTEEAPLLASMPLSPSTHGLYHVYEKLAAITPGDYTAIDAARTAVNLTTNLENVTLSIIAGILEQGKDSAQQLGGFDAVIRKKLPKILKKTGENVENDIIYNSFRSYAEDNSKLVSGGGSASANYTMLAITWTEGEMEGVFDKNIQASTEAMFFELTRMSNGGLYKNSSNLPVFGLDFTGILGVMMANPRYIAGIVNCDITNDDPVGTRTFPTIAQIDQMLVDARANSSTRIYCHPNVKNYLGATYKSGQVRYAPRAAEGVNDIVPAWNDVEIVPSYNFTAGSEATVSL